jgi:predicted MFS family arabinose efflux permease
MTDLPSHVAAVLSALQFRGGRPEGLRTITASEWEHLLSFWEVRRLMIPLRQVCGDYLPEWVCSRIDHSLADNAERLERIKADYSNFLNASRAAGAEHLVVKGFAQWPGFVDHPRFRSQSDIDVYCPPELILRARDVLTNLGYEPKRGQDSGLADHLPGMFLKTSWHWRGNYYDPEMRVSFELHFSLWNESTMRLRPKGLDRFWSRRTERRLDDIDFPALNAVDNFGYAALNLTRNLLRIEEGPHQAYELARFLHMNADNEQFWKEWRETHDDSLRRLEAIACRLAFQSYSCRLAEEVENEMNRLPTGVKAWFDKFAASPRSAHFRPEKDGLWLHLSLLECSSDQRSILRERLFPTRVRPIEHVIDISGEEQEGRRSHLWRYFRYLAYIISRLAHHLFLLPSTLWRGVCFWWSTRTLGQEFWKFFAASFLFNVGMFIFFFLYNLYLLDRGFRENFLGLLVSASAVGGVAGCIPSGMVAQRFGLRKTLLLSLTLGPLISASLALAAPERALLVLSFFGGAIGTIWPVIIAPAIARLTREQNRSFGFSLIFSSGIAVGVLGSQVASHLPGWLVQMNPQVTAVRAKQIALLIGCTITALAAWPAFRLKFAVIPVREKMYYPRNPFLLRFLAAIAVWTLVTGSFSPFYNAYFAQYFRMPLERIGVVSSVSQISQTLGFLAAPFIFKKFGIVTGIVYMQVATAIALGCLAAAPRVSLAAAIYTVYTALLWMSQPGMYSLLMSQVAPSEQAGASALNFLVISLMGSVAAAASGFSFVRFGYPPVLAVIAAVALAAAVLFRSLLGKNLVSASEPAAADSGLG